MSHGEVEDSLPLLALDALEPWEEIAVRAHVEGCAECATLLADYFDAAAYLAQAVPPVAPPARLTRRIFEAVGGVSYLPARARASARAGSPRGRRLAALVTAAAVFVPGMLAFSWHRIELTRVSESQGRAALAQVMQAPSHQTLDLTAAGTSPGVSGQVLAAPDDEVAAVVLRGLENPGSRIYVVWAIENGTPRPLAEFRPDDSGSATVGLRSAVGGGTAVAVTLESMAGRQQPAGPTILAS
jgi:hypothetical protein